MSEASNPFAAFAGLTLSVLEDSLGVLYIGYILAAVGYGFTFFQSYYYYSHYPRDYWVIKATVAALCILDTAMSILSSHAIYYYLVTLFALPVGPDEATSAFCVEILLSGFAVFVVQSFYAIRVWQMSQNRAMAGVIVLVAVGGAGLGVATIAKMLHNNLFSNFGQSDMKAVIATGQGLRALGALLIAGSLNYYVERPVRGQLSVLDMLAGFITSGVAATLAQLLCMITFLAMPRRYVWTLFHLLASRVFINGLLLMLNTRAVSRGRGVYEEATRVSGSYGSRSVTRGTTASDIRFARSTASRGVRVEVARTVRTDGGGVHAIDTKQDVDVDTHSLGHQKAEAL
ncbi:hypothetical protein B0H10DRAFT_2077519 [Mycena sp. CBHHK59/15]|nr:hypothetical protein B0H10DRAFT_2077519 [Mycena sp. CBHHK59/15]